MAVNSFVVAPRFGPASAVAILRNDLARSLEGSLPLADRLAAKERVYARRDAPGRQPPAINWLDDAATEGTVLELRTDDAIGLLYRVTAVLERCGVDIRSARVSSLGVPYSTRSPCLARMSILCALPPARTSRRPCSRSRAACEAASPHSVPSAP
jgi:[protein-PII] uridylyltransferase